MRTFDVVVIGAGPSGEVAAGRLAEHGHEVALVESHLVGGECAYYACMPSKALLRPREALDEVRRIPGAREAATGPLDVSAVLTRRDEVIHDLDDNGQLRWLEERKITLFRGRGRLAGARRVSVGEELISAREAVIVAVGTSAAIPPIPGLDEAQPWTNREVTTAHQIPERLVVLGGGAVGSEMTQAFATLGSVVTIVEALPRLLPQEEPFAGEQLAEALRELGVDVRVGTKVTAVTRENREVVVQLDDGYSVTADEILVAVGRRPSTDELGLETVGLEPGRHLPVDDRLRVSGQAWLYAIGDVNGRSLLTHTGKYQARVVSELIDGREMRALSDRVGAPRVVFTDPQVAAAGLTLAAASEAGMRVTHIDVQSAATAGASFHGRNTPGTSRLVIDTERRVVVGATFTGFEVAEWLQAATIAIAGEVPVERLWEAIPAFPTRSEIWLELLECWERHEAAASGR